ncbi:hypothetical protein [Aquibacillus albus]|uniref:Peptidyl-prolyl cis-trans isomerase n=1 Tax=Aquibacillus albus TaxID=1168171 RepID=A0ABS2N281_9BACI|nr:hypothetical protein [Aquibacillus albus]MBM7572241.1 hypothetical protein [Aquibacillus albus]
MIVQLTGNVSYSITLDPTVWIFDDRKILFDDAFDDQKVNSQYNSVEQFDRETFIKPPVNKSIAKFEREKILTNTYVMPIKDFLKTAEISTEAQHARLQTSNEEGHTITLDQLQNCFLMFAKEGKPLKEDGPVHLYFGDGSNKNAPIKGIKKIIIE